MAGSVVFLIIAALMCSSALADDELSRFVPNATREAGEKLISMERSLEEKKNFQLETQTDVLNFESSNRDLAIWYAKTVARGMFKNLFQVARENFSQDQKRNQREEQRLTQRSEVGSRAGRGPATWSPPEPERKSFKLPNFIEDTAKFVRRLTDDGISLSLPVLSANFRFDTNRPRVETKVVSDVLDVSLDYRVDMPKLPEPLPAFEEGGDLFVVSGTRQFDEIGISGNVQYQLEGAHLLCSLSKQVVGPVYAQIERQWDFTSGEQESSTARLSMSLAF